MVFCNQLMRGMASGTTKNNPILHVVPVFVFHVSRPRRLARGRFRSRLAPYPPMSSALASPLDRHDRCWPPAIHANPFNPSRLTASANMGRPRKFVKSVRKTNAGEVLEIMGFGKTVRKFGLCAQNESETNARPKTRNAHDVPEKRSEFKISGNASFVDSTRNCRYANGETSLTNSLRQTTFFWKSPDALRVENLRFLGVRHFTRRRDTLNTTIL